MKFLVLPPAQHSRARPPVLVFLAFAAVLVLALAGQRALEGEWTAEGVTARYLGSGEPGEELPLLALLEGLHTGAFVYGFLWLMLGSLLVASDVGGVLKQVATWGGPAAAVADLASPFLVVWLRGAGALRVVTGALGLGLALLAIGVAAAVFGRRPRVA